MRDKKLMFLIGLGVLAVISLIYGIVTPSKVRRDLASNARVNGKESSSSVNPVFAGERGTKRTGFSLWGRNPFLSREVAIQTENKVVLNGIAWDEEYPRAVINDQIVRIGDNIAGSKIVQIDQDRVVLNDGINNFELRLGDKK